MQLEHRQKLRKILFQARTTIHLIGVAGSGMSGLARLFLQHGHRVSGSDLRANAEVQKLEQLGLIFTEGHEGEWPEETELVVYSSAITERNPEMQKAEKKKILCARRGDVLAVWAEQRETVVVAGMHGKTTTASMLAHTLREAGWNSSYYVGAEIPILGVSARWDPLGAHFVVEADESDGSLVNYQPQHALILNIEEEHLDHYRNLEEILAVFRQVLDQTKGQVIYCLDDRNAALLCAQRERTVSYGFSDLAQYQAQEAVLESFSSRFLVVKDRQVLGRVSLQVPGRQNISNALGVLAMAMELGLPFHRATEALAQFQGARRRFELKYQSKDYAVVDDYAHHPTEIRATLSAAKNSRWQRVIAMFQPHRYSRTKLLRDEFATAFKDADALYLTDIYAASELPLEGISGETIAQAVRESGQTAVVYEKNASRLRAQLSRSLAPGDLVLTMGAGDIHQVASALSRELGWYEGLRAVLGAETKLVRGELMEKHTSIRIGGPAQLWCEPANEDDLAAAVRYAHQHSIPVTLIGRGTNLLVRDGGIAGLCLHLGSPCFNRIEVEGHFVTVGAGARLKSVVAEAKKHGLGGFEFMEGIPGNLGGALRMNAGAMQGWTMEVVEEVKSLDPQGNWRMTPRADLQVQYRRVPLFEQHIAVSARLRGQPAAVETINEKLQAYSQKRWSSQPAAPSAGCIFKNPGPCPAGKLIDELGLKNLSVGPARVSDVHGNFIVNDGGATAADVLELISKIQQTAQESRGIALETEVIVLGES
jgi:UDP-N-acetylmuramate--L-alanine ligase/UDP-N-acetylenolpyruvoylglucosamine reductase